MNLLPLIAAFLPWARTPLSAFTSVYLACALLSLEMQVVTVTRTGTLRTLVPLNLLVAAASAAWHVRQGRRPWAWFAAVRQWAPVPVLPLMAALVLFLNLWLPFEAADPYQLERVVQIERMGTLSYDGAADPKVNIVTGFYELLVADVRQLPYGVGPALVRLHGVAGLAMYALTLAGIAPWFSARSLAARSLLFLVPVLFHQFVLFKNDLFLALPSLAALAWLISGSTERPVPRAAWAGWLAGMVVGSKIANAPLAATMATGVLLLHPPRLRTMGALAAGGLAGAMCGGLALTLYQNAIFYGDMFASGPMTDLGGRHPTPLHSMMGIGRFLISLVDLELITTRVWPGRGGWGSTLGLPAIWALAVLISHAARLREALMALLASGACMLAFAAVFQDADLAQRIVLGPGLLLVVVAASVASRSTARWLEPSLRVAVVLSAAQIVRSALLYLARQPLT
jgi:hypothetical protein